MENEPSDLVRQLATRATWAQFMAMPHLICVEPEQFKLTEYQQRAVAAMLANKMNIGIASVKPLRRVETVLVFDVMPYRRQDPPLIIAPSVNLSEYYRLWTETSERYFHIDEFVARFATMCQSVATSISRGLTISEAAFLIIELLLFKNRVLCERCYSSESLAEAYS